LYRYTTGSAVVRVPPAVSRVTINVHAVRGVRANTKGAKTDGEDSASEWDEGSEDGAAAVDLTCRLVLGDQTHSTPPAAQASKAQATWPALETPITFTASEPRGGALAVDLLGPDGKSLGRVDVDLASLQLRPRKGPPRKHWIRLQPPEDPREDSVMGGSRKSKTVKSGKSGGGGGFGGGFGFGGFGFGGGAAAKAKSAGKQSTAGNSDSDEDSEEYSDDDGDESEVDAGDEYLGEILLDGFVDEGCGPTAAIGRKAPLGELSLEILSLRGITPEGKATKAEPAVMLKVGGSWALLPAAAGGAPPAWWGLYKLRIQSTLSLKPPGLNPQPSSL
jgi:hypothetical protein